MAPPNKTRVHDSDESTLQRGILTPLIQGCGVNVLLFNLHSEKKRRKAIDGMIDVPGADELSHDGVLYLAPVGSAGTPPRPVKWPKLIGKSVVYSLTGWNPMGRDVSVPVRVRVRVRDRVRP